MEKSRFQISHEQEISISLSNDAGDSVLVMAPVGIAKAKKIHAPYPKRVQGVRHY